MTEVFGLSSKQCDLPVQPTGRIAVAVEVQAPLPAKQFSLICSARVVAVLGVELSETLESSSSGQSELRVAPYTADNRIPDPIVLSRAKIPL